MRSTLNVSRWRMIPGIEGAWHAGAVPNGVPLRTVALRAGERQLVLYSPVSGLGEEAHRELAALGSPAWLVAPNHYHHLGIDEYSRAFPSVVVVASAAAIPRLRAKRKRAFEDESRLRAALLPRVSLLVPPGTRNGELWLSMRGSGARAWIVCDGFFNIAGTPRTPVGLLLRALGISPGLRIGSSFRWLVRDRAAYRDFVLAKLAEERPTLLVPCHGEILEDAALPDRLRRLVEERIR